MNKLFTKIAGLALGFAMAIGVGAAVANNSREAAPVHAATRPSASDGVFLIDFYDESKISSTSGTNLSNSNYSSFVKVATGLTATSVVTACSVSGTVRYGMNGGLTLGANNTNAASATFTIGSDYAVNKISIYGAKYDSNTLTIGGNNADSGTIANKGTTFANLGNPMVWDNLGGITSIVLSKTSGKRVTAYTLVCEYTAGSSDYVGSLSVSPSTWTGYDSQTLSVSSFTVSGSKNGTAGAVTSSDYEYKGIGYMSSGNFVARDANFSSGNPTTADTRLAWKAKYPTTAGGSTYAWAYVTLTVTADSVQSVAISGSMTNTTYNQGDAWDPTGFTVKAYYASAPSTPVDVTNDDDLSWSYNPATTASTSTTSVTCTASFGGKSATSSAQSVTVNEKQNLGGLTEGRFFLIVGGHVLKASTFAAKGADTYTTDDDSVDGLLESDAWYFAPAGDDDTWTIRVSDADNANYLYATNTNNGLVSGGTSDSWTVEEGTGETYTGKLLMKDTTNSRYISYTTSSGSYIRVYGNTNNGDCAVSFVPYVEPVTLDSLTISGATATFTAGDYFSLGNPTITATYSTGAESIAANDSGLSFKLGGNAITTSTRLTSSDNGKSLVVRYTDSENRYADATGYTLTVNPKPVQSVILDKASVTFAKGGTAQLTATVSDEYAIQTVKWTTSNSSIATVSAATSTSGNAITVTGSSSNAGSATITAYVDENGNGSLDSGEKSATCTVTVSGDPVLNVLDNEENIISGESLHAFTTDSNIYLHVDAQNFVGAITYTWSSSNTNAIAIVEEADEMCEFNIVGAGTNVRLSCHAVGATSGNLTTYVDYTVTEPQVDEVTWSAPASLSVYDNASLTAANITSWSPAYHKENGDSGSITSGYTVKLGGSTITLPHTWDTSEDGETLCIEYGGVQSSSTVVDVTQTLQAIMVSETSAWDYTFESKIWSATGEQTIDGKAWTMSGTGDGYWGYDSTKGQQFGSGNKPYSALTLSSSAFSGTITSVTVYTSGASSINATVQVSVGGTAYGDAQTITASNTSYTFDLGGKSGTVSIDYVNSSSKAIYIKEIVVNSVSAPHNDANVSGHEAAQKAVVRFAKRFNAIMDGTNLCTEGLSSAWASAALVYDNPSASTAEEKGFLQDIASLSTTEQDYAKNLIKYATAKWTEDTDDDYSYSLERAMATYEKCVSTHKQPAFMSAVRPLGSNARINPIAINLSNNNIAAVIVILSMMSIAAVGGYFFLRKRKED